MPENAHDNDEPTRKERRGAACRRARTCGPVRRRRLQASLRRTLPKRARPCR